MLCCKPCSELNVLQGLDVRFVQWSESKRYLPQSLSVKVNGGLAERGFLAAPLFLQQGMKVVKAAQRALCSLIDLHQMVSVNDCVAEISSFYFP